MTASIVTGPARPSAPRRRPGGGSPRGRRTGALGLVFTLPAMVLVLGAFVIPILISVWMSLSNWPLMGEHTFAGVANYLRVITDPAVLRTFGFTVLFAAIVTPLVLVIGLALALLVRTPRRGIGIIRTAIFAAVVVGTAAASYLWLALTDPGSGLFDRILVDLHLTPQPLNWLLTTPSAVALVTIVTVWKNAGFAMVVLMNGLNSVPREVEEAALMDGVRPLRMLWSIQLPLMKDAIAFVTTFTLIGALLTFDQFYIITGGGPNSSTITAVYSIYNTAFTQLNLGYASAISIVFMVGILVITIIQLRLIRRQGGAL